MRSPRSLRLDARHLILPLSLLLPSCFLIPSGNTECSDKRPCQVGYSCDKVTATCVKDELDMSAAEDLTTPPDLSEPDLTEPPDFVAPPDLSPVCTADPGCVAGLACFKDADPLKNRCAPCTQNSECESLICDPQRTVTVGATTTRGYCVRKADVVYVDNKNGGACTSGDGNDPGAAKCALQEGVDLLSATKTFVRVAASTAAYGKIAVTNKTGTIYGPATAMGTIPQAQIGGGGMDAVAVSGTSDLTIFGVDIAGGARGVVCSGATGKVALRRSVVRTSTGVGVDVSACGVEIDRTMIRENAGGGVLVTSPASMTMTNNIIVANGGVTYTGQAVRFVTALPAGSLFRFNTVANNVAMAGTRGAVACPTASNFELRDSIIALNTLNAGAMSQFSGDCLLVKTAVGTGDATPGNVNNSVNPDFATDYKLNNVAANDTCCVNKASNAASTALPVDYFGNARPDCTMNGCDIGAHELK